MKTMKNHSFRLLSILTLVMALLTVPTLADAQSRTRTRTTKNTTVRQPLLKAPSQPTSIDVRERTIKDLLYYPFGYLTGDMGTKEEAERQITAAFGQCESINLLPGLHAHDSFDFTYRDVPIGLAFYDWYDNRMWYDFYFESKADADRFYSRLSADIRNVGIPLANDKIYGGLSNRTHPVSIFKWVYVSTPEKVKLIEGSNADSRHLEGWYKVELGVYKRAR